MRISDFMNDLYDRTDPVREHYKTTCDVLKAGNPDAELKKIATAMFGTPDVIRAASAWGADLLIVHEPLFYDHWDNPAELDKETGIRREIIEAKRKLIAESGLTIYRYHDHPHHCVKDLISEGEITYWGLRGTWQKGEKFACNHFLVETPATARELAAALEKNLRIGHIRITGDPETVCRRLALYFGSPGPAEELLKDNDAILLGETCEWSQCELIRDYVQLTGKKRALLIMGHIGSERDGMRLLADKLKTWYPAFEARYFECGEAYSYA